MIDKDAMVAPALRLDCAAGHDHDNVVDRRPILPDIDAAVIGIDGGVLHFDLDFASAAMSYINAVSFTCCHDDRLQRGDPDVTDALMMDIHGGGSLTGRVDGCRMLQNRIEIDRDISGAQMVGVDARSIVLRRIDIDVLESEVDVVRRHRILRTRDSLPGCGRTAAHGGLRLGGVHAENEREEQGEAAPGRAS